MPNHSDLCGQSELDSPILEPPSVVEVELELDDDEESKSLSEWETSDKLSDSVSSGTDSGSQDHIFVPGSRITGRYQQLLHHIQWLLHVSQYSNIFNK